MHIYINKTYYLLKPIIPRRLQLFLRRQIVKMHRTKYSDIWPIDRRSSEKPDGWEGWPEGKQFALILTHDVDTALGQEKCRDLMRLEMKHGFRSSFNFVPERYTVNAELRSLLIKNGFEVGVHGLYHDGKYFVTREEFHRRAVKINKYIEEWNAVGYRSPSMHHNLDWFHDLNIEYDSSTFDTDPFEPQPQGMKTIFPFYMNGGNGKSYLELPYTLPQDFTLFVLMKDRNIDVWKTKLDWIAENGGMALLNNHSDYMNFDRKRMGMEEYPAAYYEELLDYVKSRYQGQYWHVLPKDLARYWTLSCTR
jgi:hypothetical protein